MLQASYSILSQCRLIHLPGPHYSVNIFTPFTLKRRLFPRVVRVPQGCRETNFTIGLKTNGYGRYVEERSKGGAYSQFVAIFRNKCAGASMMTGRSQYLVIAKNLPVDECRSQAAWCICHIIGNSSNAPCRKPKKLMVPASTAAMTTSFFPALRTAKGFGLRTGGGVGKPLFENG